MLKNLIHSDHLDELNAYFEKYKNNMYNQFTLSYRNFFNNYNYSSDYLKPLEKQFQD